MAERTIGLDIGTYAVRAAEVSGQPGSLTLHRFAQLTLPPGAVVDGEIMDSAAVTAALRGLWDKGGFKSKKVVVGIANRYVKVREAEVPALAPDEVRNALRYEAQDVIPFADEDAIVDFVVQDRFPSPDGGGELLRILVVAAQRQMVTTMLDTVRRAGLTPSLVDLTPFALVRALAPVPAPGVSEAIVSVGAGLTNVVVHTGGTPRLVRMTPRASGAVTDHLAKAVGVETARAEALKRGAAVAVADPQTSQAADVIAAELTPLLAEVQGSLDYFLAQTDDVELKRVLLTGAGSKTAGLRARLAAELRVPVEMASPLEYLRVGKTGLSDQQLTEAAAALAAPVGLAIASMAGPATKLTSLFPVEFHKAGSERRQKVAAIAALAGLTVGLGALWTTRTAQAAVTNAQTAKVERQNAVVSAKVQELLPFEQAKQRNDARRAAAQVALANDVDVVTLLDRVTAALPADVGFTNIAIAIAPPAPTPGATSTSLGTVTVSGVNRTHDNTADWITRMRELNVLGEVWVSSSTDQPGSPTGTFAGTAKLSPAAKSTRADNFKAQS